MKPKQFTKYLILSLFIVVPGSICLGQSTNVDCNDAFLISDPTSYCSDLTEFDNTNAGSSGYSEPDCWNEAENDLWFTFIATAKATNIVVNAEVGGTLDNPQVALYSGTCGNIANLGICESILFGDNIAKIFYPDLTVGEQYFIRVDGRNGDQGSFQLCVNNYNLPIEPGQDCATASVICSKESFVVQNVTGAGLDPNEADGTCLDIGFDSETRSTWFKWTCGASGTLTFDLIPLNSLDDYDFALFRINGGIDDCDLELLRCNATNGGDMEPCGPNTGLDLTSTDTEEDVDCDFGEDGYVRFIDMIEGESYALVINNFSQSNAGFSLTFGGTGEFLSPQIDISADPVGDEICLRDALISVTNLNPNVSITSYNWEFGEDSNPEIASTEGPHNVTYDSLGEKIIVLTAISDLGCQITETATFTVDSCCQDVEPLVLSIDSIVTPVCADEGFVEVSANGGFSGYEYNFNAGIYSASNSFANLSPGIYEVGVRDQNGCEAFIDVVIEPSNMNPVDAGDDFTIDFGQEGVTLNATIGNPEDITIQWDPNDNLMCSDGTDNCLNPGINIDSTTTFTITVTDANGCISSDDVTVTVEIRVEEGDIYTPNIFSPNQDGFNDYFSILADTEIVLAIEELIVFDRWGNKVYEGRNLAANDPLNGWDGRHNGTPAEIGVYTWFAKILFVNSTTDFIQGDITLIR